MDLFDLMEKRESPAKKKWREWHEKNPNVYWLFKRFTFEAIEKGHEHLSPWLIINRIRWETEVATTGQDFKISNNFIAYYSRKFMEDYPEYDGFFRTKPMKEDLAA